MDNKTKGEVSLPAEAGDGAFLKFTMDALEKLETKYGEKYFDIIISGLSKARVGVYRDCIEVAGNKVTGELPFGVSLSDLQIIILNSIFVAIYGRTYEEQKVIEEEEFKRKLEEAEKNPVMAAALLSQMSGDQDTEQA